MEGVQLSTAQTDLIGYAATLMFLCSYIFKKPRLLLTTQVGAALTWLLYGIFTHQRPIIIANVLVVVFATLSIWRQRRSRRVQPVEATYVDSKVA